MSETLCRTYTKTLSVVYVKFKCNWASLMYPQPYRPPSSRTRLWSLQGRGLCGAVRGRRKTQRATPSRARTERSSGLTWSPAEASKGPNLGHHLRLAAKPSSCRANFPSRNVAGTGDATRPVRPLPPRARPLGPVVFRGPAGSCCCRLPVPSIRAPAR